jgi:hypothetical protein
MDVRDQQEDRAAMSRRVLALRVCPAIACLLAAVLVAACGNTMPSFGPASDAEADATPDVVGTLRAGLGAALSAAESAPDATAVLTTPTRPSLTPRPALTSRSAPRAVAAPAPTLARPLPPPPTPTPSIRVEPVDFNAYRLQSGWTFIQGFVQNSGPAAAGSIDVLVSLIADGNSIVGTTHAHIQPLMLKPGARAPWLAQIQRPPAFARVRVEVQARPLIDFLQATVSQEFRTDDVVVRAPASQAAGPTLAGAVVNTGPQAAQDVRVTAAIFDDQGALFQVVSTTLDPPELPPGQSAPFQLQPVGRGLTEIARYELFVEGRPRP